MREDWGRFIRDWVSLRGVRFGGSLLDLVGAVRFVLQIRFSFYLPVTLHYIVSSQSRTLSLHGTTFSISFLVFFEGHTLIVRIFQLLLDYTCNICLYLFLLTQHVVPNLYEYLAMLFCISSAL